MKICEYCGSAVEEDVRVCPNCGGTGSFLRACKNCGKRYKEGNVCPACGVKEDAPVKTCPQCGELYYTASCPACGYRPGQPIHRASDLDWPPQPRSIPEAEPFSEPISEPVPGKKRHLFWWILGWIFIFPLPLTILLVRNKKLPVAARIVIILAAWLLYAFFVRQN